MRDEQCKKTKLGQAAAFVLYLCYTYIEIHILLFCETDLISVHITQILASSLKAFPDPTEAHARSVVQPQSSPLYIHTCMHRVYTSPRRNHVPHVFVIRESLRYRVSVTVNSTVQHKINCKLSRQFRSDLYQHLTCTQTPCLPYPKHDISAKSPRFLRAYARIGGGGDARTKRAVPIPHLLGSHATLESRREKLLFTLAALRR